MLEQRYLRFASIAGIERRDLPIAAEVWLEDVSKSCWADREIIKLSTHFVRYIRHPAPEVLSSGHINRACNLEKDQVIETLRLMVIFGAAEGYDCDGDPMRVSLQLSYLQRLRVLEVKHRFAEFQRDFDAQQLPWQIADRATVQSTSGTSRAVESN
ncbi:MAG: hypothetical protein ACR2PG_20660 [Hyphomicrobiaceae bacterium]